MGTRACNPHMHRRCVAAAAPDLRTLAGLPGWRDIADFFESQRARGSGATAHREGLQS